MGYQRRSRPRSDSMTTRIKHYFIPGNPLSRKDILNRIVEEDSLALHPTLSNTAIHRKLYQHISCIVSLLEKNRFIVNNGLSKFIINTPI